MKWIAASLPVQMPDANHAQHTYAWRTPLGAMAAAADLEQWITHFVPLAGVTIEI